MLLYLKKIIYLGGLFKKNQWLSDHLKSRKDVGDILRSSSIPVITFRASIILGSGSISFEMIRHFLKWLMLFANMAMVGVACAFYSLHRDIYHGVMNWITTIAIIGFGVGMLQSVQDLSMVPFLADQYQSGNALIKDVIIS